MNIDDIRKRLDAIRTRDPKLTVVAYDNGVVIKGAAEDGSLLVQHLLDLDWAVEAIEALLTERQNGKA